MPAAGCEEVLVLLLADVDATTAAANQHAGARLPRSQARVAPGLPASDDAEERGARVPLRIGAPVLIVIAIELEGVGDRQGRNPGSHLTGIGRDVELCDGTSAAAPAAHVLPETLAPDTER